MMTSIRSVAKDFGLRRIPFTVIILAVLGFFIIASWFEGSLGLYSEDILKVAHRIHTFAFAMLFWPFLVGLLVQLRSPKKNLSGQLMALVPLVALLLVLGLTGFTKMIPIVITLGVPTLIATLLHPAGRDLVL
ncbi:MAG: hypothetical protein ABEI86_13245, partial [Halobacteriaceae archaeon]